MNIPSRTSSSFYELVPTESNSKSNGVIIFNKRTLIGRSDNCDLTILNSSISAIHAVIEVSDTGGRIYDMNSREGVRINGHKTICQDIKLGDRISFGTQEFVFKEYHKSNSLPPVLDALEPESRDSYERRKMERVMPTPPQISGPPPQLPERFPQLKRSSSDFKVDPTQIITDDSEGGAPYLSYPLAKDPKAEFSEYIFEDADYIYPIFKWSIEDNAAEVVILHNDQIFSVDYLPSRKGVYYIKGFEKSNKNIELPYLRKDEAIPFLKVHGGQVSIEDSLGCKGVLVSDKIDRPEDFQEKEINVPVTLAPQDILKLQKNNIQIFVRNSQPPPKIRSAPLFRRDNDSRKYFFLLSILFLLVLGAFSSMSINKEIEEEKKPERVATILYNRKKFIYKKQRVAKQKATKIVPQTPTKPKTVPKPTPKPVSRPEPVKKVVAKKTPTKPTPKPVKKVVKKVVKKIPPKPAPVKKVVKKAPSRPIPAKKVARNKSRRARKSPSPTRARRRSIRPSNNRGHVDAYRPSNKFSGSLSRLLAKGGKVSGVQAERVNSADVGVAGSELGGGGGSVQKVGVTKNVGSLEGAASGRLDRTRGTEGLVDKRSVAVAGVPSNTVIIGDYDASTVADILREHLPQFRYCYQKELDRENKVSGRIELHFNIGASGRVAKAGIAKSALPSSVERCVVNILKGIKFPSPLGGGVVAIRQPMFFESRSS